MEMSKKALIIIGVVLLLGLGGGGAWFWLHRPHSPEIPPPPPGMSADKVEPSDHVLGRADAPVTMVEYFAQACSVCAAFDRDVFPLLKAKYIDTGKVRYVMRLFPLFPEDGLSHKLVLCLPPERFYQATDLMFRSQPQWDTAEFKGADLRTGLLTMAHMFGLSDEKAIACMNDHSMDEALNKIAEDGNKRYAIPGTPTFVIDWRRVDMPKKSWDEAQAAIDAALAARGIK